MADSLDRLSSIAVSQKLLQAHGGHGGGRIRFVDFLTGEDESDQLLIKQHHGLSSPQFFSSGKMVCSRGANRIRFWSLETLEEDPAMTISAPGKILSFALFGHRLACSLKNGRVQIWDVETHTLLHDFVGETASYVPSFLHFYLPLLDLSCGMCYLPLSDWLCTGSYNGTLSFWDLNRGTEVKKIRMGNGSPGLCIAHCESNRVPSLVLIGSVGQVAAYSLSSFNLLRSFSHDGFVTSISHCPREPDVFVTGGSNGVVAFWDHRLVSVPFQRKRIHKTLSVNAICPLPGRLWTSHDDKTVLIWDEEFGVNHSFSFPPRVTGFCRLSHLELDDVAIGVSTSLAVVSSLNCLSLHLEFPNQVIRTSRCLLSDSCLVLEDDSSKISFLEDFGLCSDVILACLLGYVPEVAHLYSLFCLFRELELPSYVYVVCVQLMSIRSVEKLVGLCREVQEWTTFEVDDSDLLEGIAPRIVDCPGDLSPFACALLLRLRNFREELKKLPLLLRALPYSVLPLVLESSFQLDPLEDHKSFLTVDICFGLAFSRMCCFVQVTMELRTRISRSW